MALAWACLLPMGGPAMAAGPAVEDGMRPWSKPLRHWLVGKGANRVAWAKHASYRLDGLGLPYAKGADPIEPKAVNILMMDGGEGFDPSRESYADSLPHRFQERLEAVLGRSVRVHYGGLAEIDSLRLRQRTRRLLGQLKPDVLLVFGVGCDRYLNDPRAPFLAVNDADLDAALEAPGLAVRPWKSLSHFIVGSSPSGNEPIWNFEPNLQSRTWTKQVDEAEITTAKGDVRLVTDSSRYHYQIASHELTVVPGGSYSMECDVVVTSGTMSIGIVDLAADAWIANKTRAPSNPASGMIAFEAPSERLQVVLANATTDPARSVAYVKEIAVRGRRGAAAPAVATAPRSRLAGPRRVLYELDPTAAAGTWSKGVDEASVTKVDEDLKIVSDVSRYHQQLVSAAVSVVRGKDYLLDVDVDVTSGGMAIGVLDADAGVWIVQRTLEAEHRGPITVPFAASSRSVRLVVANSNSEPGRSSARIRRLVLSQAVTWPLEPPGSGDVDVFELYRLIPAPTAKTWSKGDVNTTVSIQGGGLELLSGESRFLYQIVSSPIEVVPGAEYSVDYRIEVTSGLMAVGVLDAVANAWIVQHPLGRAAESRNTLSFTAPSDAVLLVVSNNNSRPARSSARVRRLVLRGPAPDGPPEPAEAAPVAAVQPAEAYRFEDHRVTAFSRTNLKAMVALAKSSDAMVLLAYHWWRDILLDPRQRRARHQAGRPSLILSLRHEAMTTTAYDQVVGSVAEETRSPLIEGPAFERSVSGLAAELTAHVSRQMERSKP